MTIMELGAFGEFIGAMAVVATLIFLGIQVRHSARATDENNRLARAAALDEGFRQFSGFRRLLASDPDVTRVWLEGLADAELNEVDTERFRRLAMEMEVVLRNNYVRQEIVGHSALSAGMPLMWAWQIRQYPGLRKHWERRVSELPIPAAPDETGFFAAVGRELQKLEGDETLS